jgi:hypothetical protein
VDCRVALLLAVMEGVLGSLLARNLEKTPHPGAWGYLSQEGIVNNTKKPLTPISGRGWKMESN